MTRVLVLICLFCGCAQNVSAPSIQDAEVSSRTPLLQLAQEQLVPHFYAEALTPLTPSLEYPFSFYAQLAPVVRTSYARVLKIRDEVTLEKYRDSLRSFGPLEINLNRAVTTIKRLDTKKYDTSKTLSLGKLERGLLVSLVSFDAEHGLTLPVEDTSLKMYFMLLNRDNLRYFTVGADGKYRDPTFFELCTDLGENLSPALVLGTAKLLREGFKAQEFQLLDSKAKTIALDLAGIAMAEEFRQTSKSRFRRKNIPYDLDPLALLKTALVMLHEPKGNIRWCKSIAKNFIATRFTRKARQADLSEALLKKQPSLSRYVPADNQAPDLFELAGNAIGARSQSPEDEEFIAQFVQALSSDRL